jgi:hypothetical protein
MIFVNSMSDLFQKEIERSFIDRVFDVMEAVDWHVYQVLTKRSSLMLDYVTRRYSGGPAPAHIWLGVSVEDRAHTGRIAHLRRIDTPGRFVSFEPLLGPIGSVDLDGVAWAIVGGESGPVRGRCSATGPQSFGNSAPASGPPSSSSNGAAHGLRQAAGSWTAGSGTVSLGRVVPSAVKSRLHAA